MADRPPDLKVMLTGIARAVNRQHPGTVLDSEIQRVNSADNVLLVLSRVLTAMAKRNGVSKNQVLEIVAEAKKPAKIATKDLFDVSPTIEARITGNRTDWEVIGSVDVAMASLESRAKVPTWFINEFWPPILQRCASGSPMSDREKAVAMYVASVARGEW